MKDKKSKKEDNENKKEVRTDKYPDEFYFDDCPICRAMKAAKKEGRELALPELQELFKKANEEQKFKN